MINFNLTSLVFIPMTQIVPTGLHGTNSKKMIRQKRIQFKIIRGTEVTISFNVGLNL